MPLYAWIGKEFFFRNARPNESPKLARGRRDHASYLSQIEKNPISNTDYILLSSMKEARYNAAAAHHQKKGFLITGGYINGRLSSCEITQDGVTFEDITPLPIPLYLHCMVALNDVDDGDFFVAGGYYNSKRAFIHNGSHWNEMTEMPTGRHGKKPSLEMENELICLKHIIAGLMCGPVRASPGGRIEKIVAAGGIPWTNNVEIYDITGNNWATGEFREFGQWQEFTAALPSSSPRISQNPILPKRPRE